MAISRLYTFVAGDPILAAEVNAELDALITEVNLKPDANGAVQTNLNSDMLDGYHASLTGGANTIPVCSTGNIQVQLNADLLDGLHASDFVTSVFASGTAMLFYQANPPTGWTKITGFSHEYIFTVADAAVGGVKFGASSAWQFSGITGTIDGHTLTVSELPSHNHNVIPILSSVLAPATKLTDNTGTDQVVTYTAIFTPTNTSSTGGDGSHTHGVSGLTGDGTWRPPRAWCIPCTKN